MDYATRKPGFNRNFAVGYPAKAEWRTNNVFQGYVTVLFTKGSMMICEVGVKFFSDAQHVVESYGVLGLSVLQVEVVPILEVC